MNKKEMLEQIAVLEIQNQEFNKIIRDLEKKVTKNLYWWFILPIAGFIVFEMLVQKRKKSEQWQNDSLLVKTELTKNEFQILKLKKQLKDLEKNSI